MLTTNTVDLFGSKGRGIHNKHYRHDPPTKRTCVVIAGFGYTIEAPYLYFSEGAAFKCGFDVLAIDFEYSRDRELDTLTEDAREERFQSDVRGVQSYLTESAAGDGLFFIGKSLGAAAILSLARNPDIRARTLGAVWLTPSRERHEILRFIGEHSIPSLIASGTDDPVARDVGFGAVVGLPRVTHFSVEGGDHSLETPQRARTLRALQEYLEHLDRFLGSV